ncbi:hypothetical protein Syun_029151 [Stephania yunnanensis]|uniref:Uncharacterized protein n=1 Tax=Stephania yunnanensis TaxID=152371 RepID=A0AAP0HJ70_9MAGN
MAPIPLLPSPSQVPTDPIHLQFFSDGLPLDYDRKANLDHYKDTLGRPAPSPSPTSSPPPPQLLMHSHEPLRAMGLRRRRPTSHPLRHALDPTLPPSAQSPTAPPPSSSSLRLIRRSLRKVLSTELFSS